MAGTLNHRLTPELDGDTNQEDSYQLVFYGDDHK